MYNAKESARTAGYKGTDETLCVTGSRLLSIDNVSDAIAELVRKASAKTNITPEKVLFDLEAVRVLAIDRGQLATAARASELHGKYLKMFVDRVEHVRQIDDVTNDELGELLRDVAGKLDDFNINSIFAGSGGAGAGTSEDGHGDHSSGTAKTH